MEVLLSDVLALPASSKLQLADELAVAVAAAAAAGLALGLGVLLALSLILIRLKSPLFGVIVRSFSSALSGNSIESIRFGPERENRKGTTVHEDLKIEMVCALYRQR